jgi:hypothetical protein
MSLWELAAAKSVRSPGKSPIQSSRNQGTHFTGSGLPGLFLRKAPRARRQGQTHRSSGKSTPLPCSTNTGCGRSSLAADHLSHCGKAGGCGARRGPEAQARLQYLIDGTTSIVSAVGFSGVENSDDAFQHLHQKLSSFYRSENHFPEFLVVSLFCASPWTIKTT